MLKPLYLTPLAALALAACGSSTDASEDAMADTVEIPADEAMANAPDPVADPAAAVDNAPAADGSWTLRLTPRAASLARAVSSIEVAGCERVAQVEVRQANGDRMEISLAPSGG